MAHHCRSASGWCESRTRQGLPPQQSQQDCAFAARPTIHAGVFNTGHTGQASINPSWERFPCGVRGVGRIRTSGGLRPCCFRDSRIRPLCHYSTDPHEGTNWLTYSCGSRAPGGIRTHDHKVRTLLLWSAELRERGGCLLRFKKSDNPFPKEVIRFFWNIVVAQASTFSAFFSRVVCGYHRILRCRAYTWPCAMRRVPGRLRTCAERRLGACLCRLGYGNLADYSPPRSTFVTNITLSIPKERGRMGRYHSA